MKVVYKLYDGTGDRPDVTVAVVGGDLHACLAVLDEARAATYLGYALSHVVEVSVCGSPTGGQELRKTDDSASS